VIASSPRHWRGVCPSWEEPIAWEGLAPRRYEKLGGC
jgi:hypothetical protein